MSTEPISVRLSAQIQSLEKLAVNEIRSLLGIHAGNALSQAERIEIAKKNLQEVNRKIAELEKPSVFNNIFTARRDDYPISRIHNLKLARAALTMFINGMSPREISRRIRG